MYFPLRFSCFALVEKHRLNEKSVQALIIILRSLNITFAVDNDKKFIRESTTNSNRQPHFMIIILHLLIKYTKKADCGSHRLKKCGGVTKRVHRTIINLAAFL